MNFRVLGPIRLLRDDRPITLTGAKLRTLLAVLLLYANSMVSIPRLIRMMWGNTPPATARALLQHHVSALRGLLDEPGALTGQPSGYLLRTSTTCIDIGQFHANVLHGRSAMANGDPSGAIQHYAAALYLWRGPALSGATEELIRAERPHLDELRLAALTERIDAQLALGLHSEVIAELRTAVAEHPDREHQRGQLMLALYHTGRVAEALDLYADGYAYMRENLGLDLGARLRQLHRAILARDESLEIAGRGVGSLARSRLVRPATYTTALGDDPR